MLRDLQAWDDILSNIFKILYDGMDGISMSRNPNLVGMWFEFGTALVDHWSASGISRSMVTSLAVSSKYLTMAWA